jgi:Uma2 family endonuclease
MTIDVEKRLFTVAEYYQMAEAGIFNEDDRVELIHGEILHMSPIGSPHMACVNRLTRIVSAQLEAKGILSIQNPIGIDDYSEPEPDVAILKYRSDHYEEKIPIPSDVLLVIEVADTSIKYDRNVKIPLYAEAGISEAWLVNLSKKEVTVFTEPMSDGYVQSRRYRLGNAISCKQVKELEIKVNDLFWLEK